MSAIRYGDNVFITLPRLSTPMIFNGLVPHYTKPNQYEYVPILSSGSIANGDSYIIEPININNSNTALNPQSVFRLKQVSQNKYLYDNNGIVYLGNDTDNKANWSLKPVNLNATTIDYNQEFRLVNQGTGNNAVFSTINNVTMITSKYNDTTNNSIFKFLKGPFTYAQSQCCQGNILYTRPNMCGIYKQGSSVCHTIPSSQSNYPSYTTSMVGSTQSTTPVGSNPPTHRSIDKWYIIGGIFWVIVLIILVIFIIWKLK
ncbi:hypothetical protein [Acanthamoeba castellanii mimivirus]|uniref:Uncharacterized protein L778 n=5 Tax=Mimivirus TaxID=315393 RepID=YL778_MIMIV|nr:hypothetical protein MIMI_gp0840 [Acanthamoeba polyphaga mimivirus]Q5UPR2.1 RecName: Full=Uncharacterized protein L778 [Acanthamoeba polyphaga mimivirus]AEQ60993.1 hypothetical protein [Acanthamoeba castellanii mamavirus]AHA45050.1 hypothetical protein HIRU_S144 [Hirudovirus strain Sangsue]ALR84399.1 hypothetical protein [Niemeyer virus]AMZ03220.1 hypothetical protein [Mimivirus Bombay]EJN40539.1 hypothetical protein lvs_L681 [Acanthamoeba polyphaga lentillevirus]BAV61916.1 hypothetical p